MRGKNGIAARHSKDDADSVRAMKTEQKSACESKTQRWNADVRGAGVVGCV